MNTIAPLNAIKNLNDAVVWMKQVLDAYEEGTVEPKEISHLAKRAQKRIESYPPTDLEKEHKDTVIDLSISLSTIDRAEGNFENFYLNSLHEELDKVSNLLGTG